MHFPAHAQSCTGIKDVKYIFYYTYIYTYTIHISIIPCKRFLIFWLKSKRTLVLFDFQKIQNLGYGKHMKITGNLYIFGWGFMLRHNEFQSTCFWSIFTWRIEWNYKKQQKNSLTNKKRRKTAKNGPFCLFFAVFKGFWDIAQKRL